MPHETLEDLNASEGFHVLFTYVNDVTGGIFSIMLLLSLFLVIALGTYFSALRTKGKGDLPASCAVAGFVTSSASILMLGIDGLVSVTTVVTTVVISILFVAWFFIGGSSD